MKRQQKQGFSMSEMLAERKRQQSRQNRIQALKQHGDALLAAIKEGKMFSLDPNSFQADAARLAAKKDRRVGLIQRNGQLVVAYAKVV